VLRGVLALPVVDLQRRDDAVALAAVPALALAAAVERAARKAAARAVARARRRGRRRAARERDRALDQVLVPAVQLPRDHAHALREVAQLAHVAGEVGLRHRIAEPVRRFAERLEFVAEHVAQQCLEDRDLVDLAALFQARHVQLDHREPVEQVGAEVAARHHLAQVAVGGRHQPKVDPDRRRRAQPRHRVVFQHAQQLHLLVARQVADLVEEQRAARGLLEVAAVRVHRARERALGVAEEERLEEPVGNRAAVHRHERALAVVLVPEVQLLRDALLAHAGLAAHQHAVVAVGKGAHLGQQRLHGLRVRHQHVGRLRRHFARAQLPHQLGDHRAQLGAGEVVGQHVQVLGRIGARVALARARGHPDHRHALQPLGGLREAAAVDHRHADDRHRRARRHAPLGLGRREAVGPDDLHVEARHAPRDALEDVGFAFPDKEVEFVEVGGTHMYRFNKPAARHLDTKALRRLRSSRDRCPTP
jgi:hypothetical protein